MKWHFFQFQLKCRNQKNESDKQLVFVFRLQYINYFLNAKEFYANFLVN